MDTNDLLKEIKYYETLINQYQKYTKKQNILSTNSYNSRNFNRYATMNQYRFVKSAPKVTVQSSTVIRPKSRRIFHNKVWIRHKNDESNLDSEETTENEQQAIEDEQQVDLVNGQRKQNLKIDKKFKISNSIKWKNKWNSLTGISKKRLKDYRANYRSRQMSKVLLPKEQIVKQNKFRKINIPCPIFRRYGKCSRNDKNRCKYVHDFKYVNICRRFLIGACDVSNCTLSHSLSWEKVPTCRFFLLNKCINDNCPYLHVKVNSDAALCPDFLNGFCQAAEKCLKRHEIIPLPKQLKKVTEKLIVPEPKLIFSCNNNTNNKNSRIQESSSPLNEKCARYYSQDSILMTQDNNCVRNKNLILIPANSSIGPLSSFIPFN